MGQPCTNVSGAFVWYLFFILCLVLKGINAQDNGNWLGGHATFYGSDQNPTTLGKLHFFL